MGLVQSLFSATHLVVTQVLFPRMRWARENYGDKSQYAILISGCDSGFGNMLAKRLAAEGFTVYANCLTEEGASKLRVDSNNKITTLVFDVTDEGKVCEAADVVANEWMDKGSLYAIVNNAGILTGCTIEATSMAEYRRTMDLNFLAHVVLNLTSLAGLVGAPGLSAYSASKFALEAFNDSLRREMRYVGLKVVAVEPGSATTPLVDVACDRARQVYERMPPDQKELFGEDWSKGYVDFLHKVLVESAKGLSASVVVDAMYDALTFAYPKQRYLIGAEANLLIGSGKILPAAIYDGAVMALMAGDLKPPAYVKAMVENPKNAGMKLRMLQGGVGVVCVANQNDG